MGHADMCIGLVENCPRDGDVTRRCDESDATQASPFVLRMQWPKTLMFKLSPVLAVFSNVDNAMAVAIICG